MSKLQLYILFHTAGGLPLIWCMWLNLRQSKPAFWPTFFALVGGFIVWPVMIAFSVYETISEAIRDARNG